MAVRGKQWTDKFKKLISKRENLMPKHENVIKNFVNIELFHKEDSKQKDCLGWITIMEKGGEDLRKILKEEKIGIVERKIIAEGILNGREYLEKIGIYHFDLKMENILMVGGIPKIIDFGLVKEETGKSGYRGMGYARRGSKFRHQGALFAATPGFAYQAQFALGDGYYVQNLFYFLFCDWKTSWTLLYKPSVKNERKKIDEIVEKCNASSIHKIKNRDLSLISEITSVISIPSSSSIFCLDDRNLTKSVNVSSLKQNSTRCVDQDLQNLTKDVINQKSSDLCVPISVATLLRVAMKNDLGFQEDDGLLFGAYSAEKILASLNLIVYPRSMAGLNLNPNEKEKEFQTNEVELLLERLCKETFLMATGWEIIRQLYFNRPEKSTCRFQTLDLNENFIFTRPLTVTGAYLFCDDNGINYPVFFHQMVLDRVDDQTDEYFVQNTAFDLAAPVLRIPKSRAYYVTGDVMLKNTFGPGEYKFYGKKGEFMWLVNERFGNMQPNTWYLLPQAYSITLVPEK